MKYNTISTSSLASEDKKSSFTIYADMDISHNKITYSEAEMTSIRGELEIVQKALKLQTKRCRQLVAEYTRRLQEKEVQYRSEKALRDDQLAKVLRALLIFEARLRQEQKFITHQLNEKDYIINKQSNDIKKLLSNQYCKSCNQFYRSSPINESLDSSSEYVVTDFQDYQSSHFESLDSSSETYATLSEKGYNKTENLYQSYNLEENSKSETESVKILYQKNRNKDSLGRRSRKITHRKSIGTYFEVLKLRNDNSSPMSNEDNTSNDYDNLDSLPPESITDKISLISGSIECIFENNPQIYNGSESSPNISLSECNNTVINKSIQLNDREKNVRSNTPETNENSRHQSCKITESIPVFEVDEETNDNWYASASDPEDDEHRDIYRNNPVLECMNQILLQNINDSLNSPPKTPNIERKSLKRVKFSDEGENKADNNETSDNCNQNYYETPIQKTPNFYETPQSIYSNDYEQILSKCSENLSDTNQLVDRKFTTESSDQPVSHYYVHMENKSEDNVETKIIRKSKILRTPPALPPKPANLTTKYKNQNIIRKSPSEKSDDSITELEPDYCSISELNLPQTKSTSFKKINVVAEINAPTSLDVLSKLHPQLDNDNFIKISPVESKLCKTGNAETKVDFLSKLHSTNDIKVKVHSPHERVSNIENKSNTTETKSDVLEKVQPVVENKPDILEKIIYSDNKQNATGKILEKVLSTDAKRDNLAKIHLNESKVDKLTKISSSEARHHSNQTKANISGSMISNDPKHDVLGNRHFINETQVMTFTKSPSKDILGKRHFSNDTKTEMLSKMYYTKECNINVLGKLHSTENKLKDKTQINDNLVVKKCVEKLNIQLAKQTPIKSESVKKIEPDIPKLPQVSEIIIPDETEGKNKDEMISQDNYVKNNSQIFKLQTDRNELSRRPIVIGSSVSSLISGFNQQLLSEIKMKPERNKLGKHLFSSFENLQNTDKQTPMKEEKSETLKFDNFDLSQNFEEFKLDDCDLEEYTVEEDMQSEISDKSNDDNKSRTSESTSSTRVELIRATNDFLTPTLNKHSIELLKKQLELQKSQLQNEQLTKHNHSARNNEPTYEHFLECTGLSSKSILTPSRLFSNHKSMLKPKDVKLRSKVRSNNSMFERHSTSSVKYWSEPYI